MILEKHFTFQVEYELLPFNEGFYLTNDGDKLCRLTKLFKQNVASSENKILLIMSGSLSIRIILINFLN